MAKRRSATEEKAKQSRQQTDPHSGSRSSSGIAAGGGNDQTDSPMEREEERRVMTSLSGAEFNARVARKAFELFERRGGDSGHDLEDWLEAERLVKEEIRQENDS